MARDVPALERLKFGFVKGTDMSPHGDIYDAESATENVTADWLAALARSARPRLLRCALLPRGSRWEEW